MVEYDNKKIHFGSANTEDFITHKFNPIQFVETSISQKRRKLLTKMADLLTSYHFIQIIGRSNF